MWYVTDVFDLIIAPASKVHPTVEEQLEQDVPGKGKNN